MSYSEQARTKGNEILSKYDENLSPVLRQKRLDDALKEYQHALKLARTDEETISAHKNIAVVYFKNLDLFQKAPERFEKGAKRGLYTKIVQNWSKCLRTQRVKPDRWYVDVLDRLQILIEQVFEGGEMIGNDHLSDQIELATAIYDGIAPEVHYLKAFAFMHTCTMYFKKGVSLLSASGQKNSLSFFAEANFPLAEGKKYLKCAEEDTPSYYSADDYASFLYEVGFELRVLEQDIEMHTAIAQAQQYLARADEERDRILQDDDHYEFGLMYNVSDMYRQVVILAKEKDLEMEAIAFSRMGRIQRDIFKYKPKAKEYYRQSIEIALSMTPRDFSKEKWFKEASAAMLEFQKDTVIQEDQKIREEREKCLNDIAADLIDINDESRKGEAFLKMIYEDYPIKNKKMNMEHKIKKRWLTALLHYFPDKNKDPEDPKKYFICEAITKRLTHFYTIHKEQSPLDTNFGTEDAEDTDDAENTDDGEDTDDGDDEEEPESSDDE